MKLNWKDSLKEENSERLFEIFSQTKRINIEPQIFAGNLLFERQYKLEKLKIVKHELIASIEEAFNRRYNTEPSQIKQEHTIKEIFFRTLLAIIIFGVFYNVSAIHVNILSIHIDNTTIAVLLGLTVFVPLLWLKKSHAKAIKKVEEAREKKDNLIKKIETELRF